MPREVEGVSAADGCTQSLGGMKTPGALVEARIPSVVTGVSDPVCVVKSVVPRVSVPVCCEECCPGECGPGVCGPGVCGVAVHVHERGKMSAATHA